MAHFDASASWSGYNYQGKVALFYALKLINSSPGGTNFSNYSLMLEAVEDFEILINNEPQSYHQVKMIFNNGLMNIKKT